MKVRLFVDLFGDGGGSVTYSAIVERDKAPSVGTKILVSKMQFEISTVTNAGCRPGEVKAYSRVSCGNQPIDHVRRRLVDSGFKCQLPPVKPRLKPWEY